ncbi:toxin Cry1Ac domain D-VI-related protein, partial [Bacillus amyloliquefaciens]
MRKKKLVAGVVSGVLVTGVAGSILFHTYQVKAEEKTLKQATTAVDSLYSSTKYTYLADNISNKKIEKAKELTEEVSDAKSKASLVRKVSNAAIMLKAEDAVHKDIVNGVIVNNLTDAKIDNAEKAVEKVKPISKELYSDLSKELDVAEDQLKQIEKVKKIIKKPSYNWEAYKKLEKEINKVSNKASKTKFKEKLKEIKEKIKAKEKSDASIVP